MQNPLKPLSELAQALFEIQRESSAVVQHKCAGCGAWYETPKLAEEFQEAFACECGQQITFTVPSIDIPKLALNRAPGTISLSDPDARLDTGMKVSEAIASAAAWWDRLGRKDMRASIGLGGDIEQSGIVQGEPWDMLTKLEKLNIIKAWHHFFVRVPEVIGTPEHEHQIGKLN